MVLRAVHPQSLPRTKSVLLHRPPRGLLSTAPSPNLTRSQSCASQCDGRVVPDHPALPTAAAALKPHRAQQAVSGGGSSTIPAPWMTQVGDQDACLGLSSSPAPPCQGILGVWIKKAANACCGEVGRVLPRGTPATNVPRSHPAVTKQNSAPPWHGQEEKCHKQGNLGRLSETKINGAKRVAASVPPSLLQPCPEPRGEQRMLPGSPAAALADTHGVLQPRCCHGNCLFLARE